MDPEDSVHTVESHIEVTGVRPWTKATDAEPSTEVISRTDWTLQKPLLSAAPIILTNQFPDPTLGKNTHPSTHPIVP